MAYSDCQLKKSSYNLSWWMQLHTSSCLLWVSWPKFRISTKVIFWFIFCCHHHSSSLYCCKCARGWSLWRCQNELRFVLSVVVFVVICRFEESCRQLHFTHFRTETQKPMEMYSIWWSSELVSVLFFFFVFFFLKGSNPEGKQRMICDWLSSTCKIGL